MIATRTKLSARYIAILGILGATLAATTLSERTRPAPLAIPLEKSIGHDVAGWTELHSAQLEPRVLQVLIPTAYLSRTYQKDNRQLSLFIAYYAQQRAGENMHSPKNCLPGSGWEIWQQDSALVPVDGDRVKINKFSIQNAGQRRILYYWYQSQRRIIASEVLGKILLVRDTLMEGRTAGSIVSITVPDVPGVAEDGLSFAENIISQLGSSFAR